MIDVRTEKLALTVPSVEAPMTCYVAAPIGGGPYPAVFVLEEIFGVNAHIRSIADRVAREGYVAIAPDIHHRVSGGRELPYDPAGRQVGIGWISALTTAGLKADLECVIAYLGARMDVRSDRLGALGFCIGGHAAFIAAALLPLRATASFYGGGIATFAPGGGPPTVTLAPRVAGRIVCFFGGRDHGIPAAQVATIEDALRTAKVRHEVLTYPEAGHAFFRDADPTAYEPNAAADAWTRVKALFAEELR
jgi:carboxymethylenebutenolidase